MPSLYATAFEIVILCLFGLCLRHALRAGLPFILRLCAGLVFGLVLELATLRQLNTYHYGQFWIMIWDVPLAVGLGWGVIIYSSQLFSDATSLPEWARPVLDGLLALSLDLAADTIAIRLGFWDWGQGRQFQFFGVPYANFMAWFWVVAAFSLGSRLFFYRPDWVGRSLSPLSAIALGLLGVVGTNTLIVIGMPRGLIEIVVQATLVGSIALIVLLHPRLNVRALDSSAVWVPVIFHLFFLVAGLVSGVILLPPVLLVISASMLALAILLHWPQVALTYKWLKAVRQGVS